MKRTDLLSITGTASKADRLLITIVTAIIEALDLTGYLVAASSLSIPLNYLAISLSLFFASLLVGQPSSGIPKIPRPGILSLAHATLFHPLLRLDLGPGPLWYFPRDPRKTY